jgi:transposase
MRSMNMIKIREILRLQSLGISIRASAESCKCSRNTIRDVLGKARLHNLEWPLPDDLDDEKLHKLIYSTPELPSSRKQEPDCEYIHQELKRPNVTMSLLWSEYRKQYPDGLGYSQFCNRYQIWANRTKAVMHIERKPGEEMLVDWAGTKMGVIDRETGEVLEAHLFVSTIGASAYPYVEAFPSESMEYWITAHINAFRYYGGTPRILVPDNLKTGVKKANNYDPELNKTYLELSEHYGCAIVPTRSRKPRDKSPVEGTVGDISTWIAAALRHQRFFPFLT